MCVPHEMQTDHFLMEPHTKKVSSRVTPKTNTMLMIAHIEFVAYERMAILLKLTCVCGTIFIFGWTELSSFFSVIASPPAPHAEVSNPPVTYVQKATGPLAAKPELRHWPMEDESLLLRTVQLNAPQYCQ